MRGLLQQFLAEGGDLLDQVDAGLLRLERDPADRSVLDEVFRAAHTVKGSSGLFDLPQLTRLMHAAEDLLDAVRSGRLELDGGLVDDLFAAFDLVRQWLDVLGRTQALPPSATNDSALLAGRLREPLGGGPVLARIPSPRVGEPVGASAPVPEWVLAGLGADEVRRVADWLQQAGTRCRVLRFEPAEQCFFLGADPLHLVCGTPAVEALAIVPRQPWPALEDFDEYRCLLDFTVVTRATLAELEHQYRYVADEIQLTEVDAPALTALLAPPPQRDHAIADDHAPVGVQPNLGDHEILGAAGTEAVGAPGRRSSSGRVLKVDQVTVDRLLDLVGQLVVAKNALPFLAAAAEDEWNARPLGRQIKDRYGVIDRISGELQAAVMDVRMLPVSVAFARFPRLVRDLSRSLGKQVRLELEGQDTAADKDVVELLADPMVHLIRNSLDHGIEPPTERLAAGKPARATVRLAAAQEPDAVVIDIIDDGRGIDPIMIRQRACERGLISADQRDAISDQDAVNLVFLPGFTTAATISDVSGRGVGMDAVRASVEAAGGSVRLFSTPGQGSRVRLRVPLSMAVSRVMVVSAGGQRFGVPVEQVTETVRVRLDRVRRVRRQDTVVLRDVVVSLLDLAATLQLQGAGADQEVVSVLIAQVEGLEVGLVVTDFHEGTEVIVKPLEGVLAGSRQFCGTALLGDGSVLLVLDLKEVLAGAADAG